MKINLIEKKKKKQTLGRLKIKLGAAYKLLIFHQDLAVKACKEVIEAQRVLLEFYKREKI